MAGLTHLEDGKVAVFKRGGTYHARIRVDGKYVWRTLKTGDHATALKAAPKLAHKLEFSSELGLPLTERKFVDVIDEYVEFRERENRHGRTSDGMLRQIKRVSRFWRAYAGKRLIAEIDDKVLREYVAWRRDYYTRRRPEGLHPNVKRDPTDKTIQFDVMVGKAIIKWASEQGYRGKLPLPTFSFTPKKKRVRPAFEQVDLRRLWPAMEKWITATDNPRWQETRQLLWDYTNILAWSGMRVGEANNLKIRDVQKITDGEGRENYRFIVRGKTGERDVIPFASAFWQIEGRLHQLTNRDPDDWFFAMPGGGKITTLADQFRTVLDLAGIRLRRDGSAFSLYSLRHHYAVRALRGQIGVYDVARNMGTSVQMIEQYYGRSATPGSMSTKLGGPLKAKHKWREGED